MSTKPKVFVTRRIPAAGLDPILKQCDAEVWPEQLPPSYDLLRQKVAECDGIVSLLTDKIDAALLDASPRLKVVSNYAVGFNNIDVPAATARGVAVGNTPGVLTDATADMAFCLLIGAARRLVEGHQYGQAGQWKTWEPLGHLGQDLAGKTLGVVGMGRIGFASPSAVRPAGICTFSITTCTAMNWLKANSGPIRSIWIHFSRLRFRVRPHRSQRQDAWSFQQGAFQQMKCTAVFINTARGPIVVEKDLIEALQMGVIFAAGLDVTDPEPPAVGSPLFQLPNLIVAPHIASATVGTRNAMAEICANNLLAGVTGQKLPAWLNPEVEAKRRK